jgi:hypothetical protein
MILLRKSEQPTSEIGIIFATHNIKFTVDADDWTLLHCFYWRARKKHGNWYAYRRYIKDGKTYEIAMHREIMKSHPGEEPHHKNHNTLDNRRINLENVHHGKHPRL